MRGTCGGVRDRADRGGLATAPIPIIPGIPLIAAGVALLGSDHPLVRSCRTCLDNRGIWRTERKENELSNVQS
jgi:hypothetical protein